MILQKLQNEYNRIQPQIIELSNYLIKVSNGLIEHDKDVPINILREQYKAIKNYSCSLNKIIKQIEETNLINMWRPKIGEEYWIIDLTNVDNVKSYIYKGTKADDLIIQRFGAFQTEEQAFGASEIIIETLFDIQQLMLLENKQEV